MVVPFLFTVRSRSAGEAERQSDHVLGIVRLAERVVDADDRLDVDVVPRRVAGQQVVVVGVRRRIEVARQHVRERADAVANREFPRVAGPDVPPRYEAVVADEAAVGPLPVAVKPFLDDERLVQTRAVLEYLGGRRGCGRGRRPRSGWRRRRRRWSRRGRPRRRGGGVWRLAVASLEILVAPLGA